LTALDAPELAGLLRETEEQHSHYEPTAPNHHWWDWYAAYVVARQQGRSSDEAFQDAVAAVEPSRR
jgi:hypothetical protein